MFLTIRLRFLPQNSCQSLCLHAVRKPNFKGLKLYCLNVNSVVKHSDELRLLVDDKQLHALCLSETKLDDTVEDNCIDIDGYQVIRKDRTRHGGGVAMYVHESLMFEFCNDFNVAELESSTIEIRLPFTKPIILMTLYRPEVQVTVYNNIHNLISNILFENKEFIMMGHINANFLSKPLDNDAKHMKNI